MVKALGSVFELSMRYLLLLHASGKRSLTESRLCACDFICTYAADFKIAFENLNGNNGYRYGEYASRCSMSNSAIKHLVLRGLVMPNADAQGFTYTITDAGSNYCSTLDSVYADNYCHLAYSVLADFDKISDAELVHAIWARAAEDRREDM